MAMRPQHLFRRYRDSALRNPSAAPTMDVEMKQTDMEADDDIDALNHLEAR
jgi:hypothetical protein